MSRSLCLTLVVSLASLRVLAEPSAPSPEDFAYATPIVTPATASAYRVGIPLDVYAKATHEDLRDIRIFNAAGELVPYEVEQAPAVVTPAPDESRLPLFPLRVDSRPTLEGLRIMIHSSATAVDIQGVQVSPRTQSVRSYLLDARQVTPPLYALRLYWPDAGEDFTGSIRVETSDDLQVWRTVTNQAAIVNLHGSGAHLVENRIVVEGLKANFWRLTWIGKLAPFEVSTVIAQTSPDRAEPQKLSVTSNGSVVNGKPLERSFDLGARLPIRQLQIVLPEVNSVAKVQLLSRKQATDPWRPIASGDFFRMHDGAAERVNEPISIAEDSDRLWIARFEQLPGAQAGDAPQLKVTWEAQDIVFLARGKAPYLLAYGSGVATTASSPLAAILGRMSVVRATAGPPQRQGGDERLQPPPRTVPWKMAILWTVLGAGLLLLAVMACRLSRELAKQPTTRP